MNTLNRISPETEKHWLIRFSTPYEIASRLIFIATIVTMFSLGFVCLKQAMSWVDNPYPGFLVNRRLVVSSLGLPDWNGLQAGLRPADKILKVGQHDLTSVDDVYELARNGPVGLVMDYTVLREGEMLTVSVQTENFLFADFVATFGSAFLQGVIFLVIGIVVFALKPDSVVSLLFFIAANLQGAAAFVDFAVASSATPFSYLLIACDTFLPALIIHFSAYFPLRHKFVDAKPKLCILLYLISTMILVPLLVFYPRPVFYRVYFPLVYSYVFIAVFCFLSANLYAYFRSISSLAKQRARVVFWGALFAFPLPLLAALLANTGTITEKLPIFTNLTALPVIIFPVAIGYSISRHNLFDVDVYIKRAVGYAFMTAIVGATYILLQVSVKSVFSSLLLGRSSEYVYSIIFALLVVFFFNPVNRKVQGMVERIFFRKKFDYKQTVITISDTLSSVLNIKEIVVHISRAIRDEMFIDNAGVIVLGQPSENHDRFFLKDGDIETMSEMSQEIPSDDKIVNMVVRKRDMVTRYDVAENAVYTHSRNEYLDRFTELGATMLIPMVYQNKVNAIITVGRKKSGQFFNNEDVELLKTLASRAAVSVENARLAEQMKHEESVRTNLARYLSPQVVDGIVNSDMQVNLGGDRKVVTVLFSDIRDFTKITENQPADKLVKMLNEYFTSMAEGIFAHQGSLDKYIGDAIVAVFGSLVPLDSPENSAVLAAIDMMERLEELNKTWALRGDFTMQMGIGICTGEVFLGNVGSLERMEFTVIGDTVNMASRLSGKAIAGQIIVTESVKSHLSTSIDTKELPPVQVKGKSGHHKVYEIFYHDDAKSL